MIDKLKFLIIFLIFSFLFIFLNQSNLFAQDNIDSRRIEEEKLEDLRLSEEKILKGEKMFLLDYGGWLNFLYSYSIDSDNDRNSGDYLTKKYFSDLRFWIKASLNPSFDPYSRKHSFYLRFKNQYVEQFGDYPGEKYDNEGPLLDSAYFFLNFSPLWIEIGRKYYKIGNGIAYSDVNDGIQLSFNTAKLNIKSIFARTLPGQDNIDTSVPGYSKSSERLFGALQIGYNIKKNHQVYGYFVTQNDFSDEEPEDPLRDYKYNSQYFGIGAKTRRQGVFNYWVELIKQTGTSRIYDTDEKSKIRAWGGDIGFSFNPDIYSYPEFSIEYVYGSGDEDRISVTDTEYGNLYGADKNFLYFGYLPAGIVLSPFLSNLHIIRLGVEFYPFENSIVFHNLIVGVNYFKYYKDKTTGGIYDYDAFEEFKDVGQEIDFALEWQVYSDLKFSLDYGIFMPGKAYHPEANDKEMYLSIGITHTF